MGGGVKQVTVTINSSEAGFPDPQIQVTYAVSSSMLSGLKYLGYFADYRTIIKLEVSN